MEDGRATLNTGSEMSREQDGSLRDVRKVSGEKLS